MNHFASGVQRAVDHTVHMLQKYKTQQRLGPVRSVGRRGMATLVESVVAEYSTVPYQTHHLLSGKDTRTHSVSVILW